MGQQALKLVPPLHRLHPRGCRLSLGLGPPGESGPGIFGSVKISPNEMDGDSAAIVSWKLLASL